jgi:peptidoglycan/xylan/chitin deacetylase (PgdA/CDA1 family)
MSLVTLTFDNGPSVGTTPLVLEHLHARNLTAYFCLIGKQLAAGNESGRGGELGKHVFSKPALDQLQALRYSLLLWNCVPRDWEDHTGWVDTALQAIDSQDHTVIVLHDLDTGAMDLLPHFLDTLLARGDIFTTTLPIGCVPMRDGALVWTDTEFAELIA